MAELLATHQNLHRTIPLRDTLELTNVENAEQTTNNVTYPQENNKYVY